MRIKRSRYYIHLILLTFFGSFHWQIKAQEANEEAPDQIAQYQEEVKQMMSFLEFSMNVLGDPGFTAKEKDVVINESYSKIFQSDKVQIEDDLDPNRDVVTNKDVQAYLKDVDFFFKQVSFEFNILDIEHSENHEGQLFFTVKLMRSLKGISVTNDSMNNDMERYVEVNVDEENKDLKIASIYTTKLSRDEELTYWWAGLTKEWRTILGLEIKIREGLRLNEIQEFSDSTYIVDGQVITDSIRVIDYVRAAAAITELDLSGSYLFQNLKPLDKLINLAQLDISGSSIKDIFPIRNITTLEYLDCSSTMIEDLGPLRYSKSLRELNISNTPITNISVIENFDNIEVLRMEQTVIDSLPAMNDLKNLRELYCGSTNLSTLDSIRNLPVLEILDCSNTAVADLAPIGKLENLRKLNVNKTQIQRLEPLNGMETLEEIRIENTEINDLAPLTDLDRLHIIYADNSKVGKEEFVSFAGKSPEVNVIFTSDELNYFWVNLGEGWKVYFKELFDYSDSVSTEELHQILNIKKIDVSGSSMLDLSGLHFCYLLEELNFSNTAIANLGPVANLKKLVKIDGSRTQVVTLGALRELEDLNVVIFEYTAVSNISPLAILQNVDTLVFNNTDVRDLSALNEMGAFELAYFDSSRVTDDEVRDLKFDEQESILVYKSDHLRDWWGNMEDKWQDAFTNKLGLPNRPNTEQLHQLAAKRIVDLSSTSIRNLKPVTEFVRLESLIFSETRVNSLESLQGLKRLKVLKCPRNPISEVDPLATITSLEVLDLNNTQVSKLNPLASLTGLKELTFSGTNVKDLSPIEGLTELEVLDFSKTKVRQIKALDLLSNLKTVNCYNNRISDKKVEEFRLKNPDCEVVFY